MKYFVLSWLAEKVLSLGKIFGENFLKYLFGKISLRFQNLFQTFGKIVFQEYIGLEICGKILHGLKPCGVFPKISALYIVEIQYFQMFEKDFKI